jgi:multidrug resistance efflux pump
MAESMRRGRLVAAAIILALAATAVYLVLRPEADVPIQGVVRGTEVRIAPEVGGHLAAIRVQKGARVRAGEVVAELSAVELVASVEQARAAYQTAVADRNHVYAGERDEQIATAGANVDKVRSRLQFAEQQLVRVERLARDSFSSRQALDQGRAQVAISRADLAEASADYAESKKGPTREERAIADARVSAAAAQVAVLESRLRKTVLSAPTDGVVQVVAGEIGEAIRAGQAVVVVEADRQPWLSFNVREDRLGGLAIGSEVQVRVAGSASAIPGRVTELGPIGQFATWQAERAVGDHDRNTLRMRVELGANSATLEPGMTVWLVP